MQKLRLALELKKLYLLQSLDYHFINPNFLVPKSNFANSIRSQKELDFLIQKCELCPQRLSTPNLGICNPDSKIVFLSMQPLLDSNLRFSSNMAVMLYNIITKVFLLSLKEVSILSLLKCDIAIQNRGDSLNLCMGFVHKQLEFCNAKIIVILGQEAYFAISEDGEDYKRVQGKILKWKDYLLFPTFSLGDLIKKPSLKTQAHKEFLTLKGYL
ncbi:uracil-DNA glycosylase family protein [Helicobacter burdigaliensis]|uniref:uracil-DNA glycosylase family protein n=1 Tax=Helicobacter burdigaliensis TaxID=2315334 RepID=UPI000EF73FF8|nr:uracil-DNA glycosylase family protein [Helicobacter burdigaliensis]